MYSVPYTLYPPSPKLQYASNKSLCFVIFVLQLHIMYEILRSVLRNTSVLRFLNRF